MKATTPIVLDGGMSRELIRLKAPFRQPEWSAAALMDAPHFVRQAHENFAAAGAEVLTTDSYALVPFHIGEELFHQRGKELAELSGRLAREVADQEKTRTGRKVLVAGSLPPIFGSYEPDRFDETKVQDHLKVLVEGLRPHVDVWLGETLSLIAEAKAVVTAVAETGKPVWISFTLDDKVGDPASKTPTLRSGETVTDAASWAASISDIKVVSFNCSQPEFMSSAIHETRRVLDRSRRDILIGVYANSFAPKPDEYAANKDIAPMRHDLRPDIYVTLAREWIANGASIVGGCCGIGCDHIKALAEAVKREN